MTASAKPLVGLTVGQSVIVGGDRVIEVDEELASAFAPGDRLVVADDAVIHLRASDVGAADRAVQEATDAFALLNGCSDQSVTAFFVTAAELLEDSAVIAEITAVNEADVASALERGRSVTRLRLDARMVADMAAGLRMWAEAPAERDGLLGTVEHGSWRIESRRAPSGWSGSSSRAARMSSLMPPALCDQATRRCSGLARMPLQRHGGSLNAYFSRRSPRTACPPARWDSSTPSPTGRVMPSSRTAVSLWPSLGGQGERWRASGRSLEALGFP